MNTQFVRSKSDKMIAGVCGGLGRALGIDSTLVRIFFVLFTVSGGFGVFAYFVLWIVMPDEGAYAGPLNSEEFSRRARDMGQEMGQAFRQPNPRVIMYAGITLIVAGLFFFIQSFDFPWLRWLNDNFIQALLLIGVGGLLLWRALRKE